MCRPSGRFPPAWLGFPEESRLPKRCTFPFKLPAQHPPVRAKLVDMGDMLEQISRGSAISALIALRTSPWDATTHLR